MKARNSNQKQDVKPDLKRPIILHLQRSTLYQHWMTLLMPLLPGLGAALVAIALGQVKVWHPLEQVGYNVLMRVHAQVFQPKRDARVVVIAIDEASLKQYGRFPWPRTRYVELLQALEPSLPDVIGFDILFAEPAPEDADFAAAMLNNGNVVLAMGADSRGHSISGVPSLEQVTGQGHVYNKPDQDGISRRSWLYIKQVPSLGVAMVERHNENLRAAIAQGNSAALIPLPAPNAQQAEQPAWLNWLGNTESIPTFSFVDVVQGKVEPTNFANKFILVGITATGFDPLQTPFNQKAPTGGVYLHAATLDNLLKQRFLSTLPAWNLKVLLLILGMGTSWLLSKQTLQGRVATVLGILIAWLLAVLVLLQVAYLWLAIAAPLGTVLLAAIGMQLREQHERQLLMSLFAQHVAPETAQMLWQRKAEILHDGDLQAQELVVTVLFMDIRGFTTISEKLHPSELLLWVNQYLEAMTDCIMDHGGVVDKYIGDAIMAIFGVPFPRTAIEQIQQDALNAIAASLEMHERLQHLNHEFAAQGKPLIRFGIGIHTGLVVAGNVGGHRRLNYSVLGDTVNVAARLEALNKEIQANNPYDLLITNETLSCLKHQYRSHQVGTYPLKGRESTTLVFSILGKNASEANPNL
ncbi:MAG: adenylate/guanylate cyclase domain-containing protein [Lyngbya sp. HA4199-MV5]|nr:adenylate/guanylate cyclase domain-containing protein [Lyngbya sp. HA4199-MV5]